MEKNASGKLTLDRIISGGGAEFFSLDFDSVEDRELALSCMDKMQLLALRMDIENPSHLEVLKLWVRRRYQNFLILAPKQKCTALINIYLEEKLKSQLANDRSLAKSVSLIHSYNKQLLLCYTYETKEGEDISYFDESLRIPIKLKTNASFKFKLIDGLKLVKGIDIELDCVDLYTVVKLVNGFVMENLRDAVLNIICEKNVSYYDLPKYIGAVKETVGQKMNAIVEKYGLSVSDIRINDISLINRIDEQLEKQFYALSKLAQIKKFEYWQEEESLKLYEKKAMIHSAYPDADLGLTEAEKDFALDRYLKRKEKAEKLEVEVNTQRMETRIPEHTAPVTPAVVIEKPEPPSPPVKQRKYLVWYILAALLWAAATITMFVLNLPLSASIPVLCAGAVLLVLWAVLMRHQLLYGISKKTKSEYEEAYETYKKLMAEYNSYNQQRG